MTRYKTLDELSHKESNYISEAINEAKQSPVKIRHGAIAITGGRVIAKGFNHYRTQSADGYMGGLTCHAECDVLHKLLKLQTNKNTFSSRTSHSTNSSDNSSKNACRN